MNNRFLLTLGFSLILLMNGYGQDQKIKIYLTMEEAISRALGRNNLIRASEFGLKKASWDKVNAWTQFLPYVSFNTRMTHIDDQTYALRDFRRYLPPEIRDQIPQTVFQQTYFTSFDVSVPLFNGALLNGLFLAKANENMARHLSASTRENIVYQVVSGYLNVLKAQEILNLQEDYLDLSRRNFEKAERLYNAGRYSKTEVLRWKVDFQQQKSVVVSNASILRSQLTNLKRLLDIENPNLVEIEGQIPELIQEESEHLAQMSDEDILELIPVDNERLIQANSALSAAESGQQTSKFAYRNAYMSYLPSLTASYSYAWFENNTLDLDDYSPKTFMVNLSVPVFTGFQNLSDVKSSYYDYRRSQEEFKDQLKETRYYLTETINRILNLKTQRELSKTNAEFTEHNYRVVAQQKEEGLVSNIDFIDAKLNLQNAKLEEINVQYDFISAMVELYYLLGKVESILE